MHLSTGDRLAMRYDIRSKDFSIKELILLQVGCSLLYFIVALLDKWSALLDGGQLLGLSSGNTRIRMPVGFALAYYLIGAVLLDFNAAKLHTMTARGQNMLIGDVSSIPEAVKREVRARRYLYWTMLGRYLFLHVWGLAVASSLLWVFDSTVDIENPLDSPEESAFLFLAYIFSYTGSSIQIPMKDTANIPQVYFGIRYIL
jgi:hypothetical protein